MCPKKKETHANDIKKSAKWPSFLLSPAGSLPWRLGMWLAMSGDVESNPGPRKTVSYGECTVVGSSLGLGDLWAGPVGVAALLRR